MARKLIPNEKVTVDQTVKFDPESETYQKGLFSVEPGQIGSVVGPALQGRATIVDFDGVQAVISRLRLQRPASKGKGKGRGSKKKVEQLPSPKIESSQAQDVIPDQNFVPDDADLQLVSAITNTLLLSGGLKDDSEAVIQVRFADLPENVQKKIRNLMKAKLDFNGMPRTK